MAFYASRYLLSTSLRRGWKSISLPTLNLLTISVDPTSFPHPDLTNVVLTLNPTWREDGHIEFEQSLSKACVELDVTVTEQSVPNIKGSNDNSHILIHIAPRTPFAEPSNSTAKPLDEFPDQFSEPTGFGNKQDEEQWPSLPYSADSKKAPPTNISTSLNENSDVPTTLITLSLPQKLHLEADLPIGDVNVTDKIEGDTSLVTGGGAINVVKLRGHNITLKTPGPIYVSKLIEAETAILNSETRLRAKLINGKNVQINVDTSRSRSRPPTSPTKRDDDDSGCLVDIGSLYTNDDSIPAAINVVRNPSDKSPVANVKVKGNHGHIKVVTNSVDLEGVEDEHGNVIPAVELGGVNGACEVLIHEVRTSDNEEGKREDVERERSDDTSRTRNKLARSGATYD
ncbi:hypothetical protein TL16_g11733 [Triparma laevis f. inornata]|uniref:Adhesin domain-containing protein n=1 Tax=Triparma laevis f. inornata TaxID=1714386 RepID=A0A9W7BPH4_9STRA|nr:hypothetical protein TL16_g11733 [Triparma laevis f. inornata]